MHLVSHAGPGLLHVLEMLCFSIDTLGPMPAAPRLGMPTQVT